MRVVQVRCPNCQQPIFSKIVDTVFYCDKCNTLHTRNGGTKVLDFEIGDYNKSNPAQKVFIPFWRVWTNFTIHQMNIAGGMVYKLGKFIRGEGDSGTLFMFIPAAEMDINQFKQLSMEMTLDPPRYPTRLDFSDIPREATKLTREEAESMADFIFVTIEADKPGVLQNLDYNLDVQDAKMVYLPFIRTGSSLTPAW